MNDLIEQKLQQLKIFAQELEAHATRIGALTKRQELLLSGEDTAAARATRLLFAEFGDTLLPIMASQSTVMVELFEEAAKEPDDEIEVGIEPEHAEQILEIFDMFKMMCKGSYERADTPVEMKNELAQMLHKEHAARELVESLVLDDDGEDDDADDDGDDDDDDQDD